MANRQRGTALRQLHQLLGAAGGRDLTDAQLLQRFTTCREEAAFAALVQRHGRLVWNVCWSALRRDHDAEDAFQATFLVLARKAGSIHKGEALASWLYGVAHRIALRARRDAARRRRHESQARHPPPRNPAGELAWRELQALLHEEVQRLPEKHRVPFVLCCLDGQSLAQTAAQLGWKEGTVSGRLTQARQLLRQRLAGRGVLLPAVLAGLALTRPTVAAPPAVAKGAVQAALLFAAGKTTKAGAPTVAALAEAGLRAMSLGKLRIAAAVLLAVTGIGVAAGVFAHLLRSAQPTAASKPMPTKEDPPATDQEGDPLPPGGLARLGTLRFRHGSSISALAFAPDGKTLAATATGEWRTGLWEVATGRQVRILEGHGYWVLCAAYSPDGNLLATGSKDRTVRLWDPATGKELRRLAGHEGDVLAVAFAPDGKTVASAGSDQTIRLWEADTGKALGKLTGHQAEVRSLAYTVDGKTLASGALDQTVRLWDTATARELRNLEGHPGGVLCVAFSSDGKTLAVGGAGLLPDSKGSLRLWDVAAAKELRQVPHAGSIRSVAFSPDGKTLAAAGLDLVGRLYDVATGKELRRLEGHQDGILAVVFSPDGATLASAGADNTIRLWDPATGKELSPFGGHQHAIRAVSYSPDSKTVATASSDRTVRLWEAATGKELRQLRGHQGVVDTVAFAPDGRLLASGGEDRTVRIWDLATGKPRHTIQAPGVVLSVAFAPDGQTLASGDHGATIRLWSVATGAELRRLDGHQDWVRAVVFAPDGKTLASASNDKTVRLWQVATGTQVRQFASEDAVAAVAFSPDGKFLATAGNQEAAARIWEVATGKLLHQPRAHGVARSVAFSPDGRSLAVGFWRMASVFEVATGRERAPLWGHRGDATSVGFSPDGRALATAGVDTTVVLWDMTGRRGAGQAPRGELGAHELEALWTDLAGPDAARAYRALCRLAADPGQALPLLKDLLKPVTPVENKRLAQLIADLDDDQFAVRERASAEIAKLGGVAEAALRKALEGQPSAEVRTRVQRLLDKLEEGAQSADRLHVLRALELLERIETPEARRLFEALARGAPEAWLTQEAKAALRRLARRAGP